MSWLPERTADGSYTLRNTDLDQACHSSDGAWQEARERYALPTRIRERALSGELSTCRLLDVGTGLGLNLAAALEALDGTRIPLIATTLEIDPAVLHAARDLPPAAPNPFHREVLETLARAGSDPLPLAGGSLHLVLGDARETLPAPPLWSPAFLAEIARRMAPGSCLSTFTTSLTVRTHLGRAGLAVGAGPRVGRKAEGTVASPDLPMPALSPRTTRRLVRRLGREPGLPPESR
jgi:tRNA U34 5-methylaminomethyl-2-thiouridine-forming methyltransferase MnmC